MKILFILLQTANYYKNVKSFSNYIWGNLRILSFVKPDISPANTLCSHVLMLKEILGFCKRNIYLWKQTNCAARFENLVFHYQAKHAGILQREKEKKKIFLLTFPK